MVAPYNLSASASSSATSSAKGGTIGGMYGGMTEAPWVINNTAGGDANTTATSTPPATQTTHFLLYIAAGLAALWIATRPR